MNKSATLDNATDFIIKRAFRAGAVTRGDVIQALGVSTATATRLMVEVVTKRGDILERVRQKIVPRLLAKSPAYASEEALLQTLNEGGHNFLLRVGLYENELPVTYVSWTNSVPRKPGILATIIEAIRTESYLRIAYVGMREKEEPASRVIAPLGLERMNDQWRVVAQDLGKVGYPIRIFVLSRILDAEKAPLKRRPPGFVHQHHSDAVALIAVTLNPKLSPLQKEIISAELDIQDGKVRLAKRGIFEFKRRFSNEPASHGAIWPPLGDCHEL
ncbi:MAG: WYL domain-containing protein [Rhodocyclaceae bacterium]|nr:WYL domain-containing protein [Rhodocyclaceae bacterium]